MNWNQVQGNWKQFMGKAKEKWGDLTDDELTQVAGKRDALLGLVQTKYGIAQEEAEQQVKDWENDALLIIGSFRDTDEGGGRPCRSRAGGVLIANYHRRHPMNIELSNAFIAPALALLAGILILLAPRFLNYFVAVYLIVVGIVGLIPLLQR